MVGSYLAVAARNRQVRPLALALACGVNYGPAAFAIKPVRAEYGGGLAGVLSHWPIYILATAGPAGFLLNQNAFQQAPVSSASPGNHHHDRPRHLHRAWRPVAGRAPAQHSRGHLGEIALLLLMITGIVTTATMPPRSQGAQQPSRPAQ